VLKWVRNVASGTKDAVLKLQDAMLAMLLVLPEMDATVRGPALVAHCMAARPRRSRPAVRDWNLSAMRLDHATVGMLSEKTPA
jgi:hypothetical protein